MENSHKNIVVSNIHLEELAINSLKKDHIAGIDYYKWNDWKLFSTVTTAKEILDQYFELILSKKIKADYFCPIPTSGLTLLSGMIKSIGMKSLTYPKNPSRNPDVDFGEKINENSKVIIGDLSINTGSDLEITLSRLKKFKLEIVGVFFIVFNDTFPAELHPDIKNLEESGKIHYLTTVSQLLNAKSIQDH